MHEITSITEIPTQERSFDLRCCKDLQDPCCLFGVLWPFHLRNQDKKHEVSSEAEDWGGYRPIDD
jgi:hypothetical protein